MGHRKRDSCRKLFTSLEILPLPSLYIYSILKFVIKNHQLFTTNDEIHNFGTWQQHNFHLPPTNIKKYQTRVYYMSTLVYNNLPTFIKKKVQTTNKIHILGKELPIWTLILFPGRIYQFFHKKAPIITKYTTRYIYYLNKYTLLETRTNILVNPTSLPFKTKARSQ